MNAPFLTPDPKLGKHQFSAREYLHFLDSGAFADMKVELSEGILLRMSPAHSAHARMHSRVTARLEAAIAGTSLAVCLDLATVLNPLTVRGPDIALVHATAPDEGPARGQDILLAVEIADSSLADDLGDKARDYGAAGIPHYWVVDVAAKVTHAMQGPVAAGYGERRVVPFDQPLAVPGTPESIHIAAS